MGITTQQQALILPAAALGSMQPLQRLRCPRGGCLPSKPRDRGMAGSCVPQSWPQRIKPPRRRRCSRCRSHATACGTAGSRQSCGGGGRGGAGRGARHVGMGWDREQDRIWDTTGSCGQHGKSKEHGPCETSFLQTRAGPAHPRGPPKQKLPPAAHSAMKKFTVRRL
jgi:hypothetical protein